MRANLENKLRRARAAMLIALWMIVACPQFSVAQTTAPPPPPDSSGSNSSQQPGDSSAAPAPAPDAGKPKKGKKDKDDQPAAIASWLLVEVIGGTDKVPVQQASVYIKFTEVHKVGRDKKMEFDLKTNEEGVARAPDVPQGKVLIQVVANGWKTFGQYYDVTQDQQTIQIALERPPRWY
jgi:hypothetical protein